MRKKVLYVFFIILVLFASICKMLLMFNVKVEKGKVEENEIKIVTPKDDINTRDKKESVSKRTVYLTFDDGPSKNTSKILDILDKYDIKATFFVIGTNITPEYEILLKSMEDSGHVIGIHTFSHKYNYIYTSADNYIKDFNKAYEQLVKILDTPPSIYRFPGGSCNCYVGTYKGEIIKRLENRGFTYYDWTVSGEDSVGSPTMESIIINILRDIDRFDNPVILLHDSSINNNTVEALETIIIELKDKGYEFAILESTFY